ncbi:unnamed protein product [Amoebophrya sp. A120]|nr:unnamed protein product [Amoebophrya sp. A120]|eukprot:GSA120T00002954001.1
MATLDSHRLVLDIRWHRDHLLLEPVALHGKRAYLCALVTKLLNGMPLPLLVLRDPRELVPHVMLRVFGNCADRCFEVLFALGTVEHIMRFFIDEGGILMQQVLALLLFLVSHRSVDRNPSHCNFVAIPVCGEITSAMDCMPVLEIVAPKSDVAERASSSMDKRRWTTFL